jgi:hypothetical protein
VDLVTVLGSLRGLLIPWKRKTINNRASCPYAFTTKLKRQNEGRVMPTKHKDAVYLKQTLKLLAVEAVNFRLPQDKALQI